MKREIDYKAIAVFLGIVYVIAWRVWFVMHPKSLILK